MVNEPELPLLVITSIIIKTFDLISLSISNSWYFIVPVVTDVKSYSSLIVKTPSTLYLILTLADVDEPELNVNFNNLVDFGFAKIYLCIRLFYCEFIK